MNASEAFLSVEYSKSNRATCKACKTKIEKGKLRIGTNTNFDGNEMVQWRHLECFKITKKWKDYDPEQIQGYEQLEEEDQKKVDEHFEEHDNKSAKKSVQQKRQKAAKKAKDDSDEDDISASIGEADGMKPLKVKFDASKIKGYTKKEWQELEEKKEELQKEKASSLKDILRLNNQKMSGTKDELIERVADGMVLGQIPKCPECFSGRPRFDYKKGLYRCPGYMDDEEFVHCNKVFTMEELPREEWISID